jgi:hypothetical protein
MRKWVNTFEHTWVAGLMMSVVKIVNSPVIFSNLDTIDTKISWHVFTSFSVLVSLSENNSSVTEAIITHLFSAD